MIELVDALPFVQKLPENRLAIGRQAIEPLVALVLLAPLAHQQPLAFEAPKQRVKRAFIHLQAGVGERFAKRVAVSLHPKLGHYGHAQASTAKLKSKILKWFWVHLIGCAPYSVLHTLYYTQYTLSRPFFTGVLLATDYANRDATPYWPWMSSSRKVVLFLPPYSGRVLGPPLGLLSLAGSLREAGYESCIIDGALDPDYRRRIAEEVRDCLCFGVSLLTGPMIRDAIEVSRTVRKLRPDLTIVFGGWHPSLMTGQTLREDFVDIVVRHQGEATLVEILQRIEAGKPLDFVAGCWFKRNGRMVENADRPHDRTRQPSPPRLRPDRLRRL